MTIPFLTTHVAQASKPHFKFIIKKYATCLNVSSLPKESNVSTFIVGKFLKTTKVINYQVVYLRLNDKAALGAIRKPNMIARNQTNTNYRCKTTLQFVESTNNNDYPKEKAKRRWRQKRKKNFVIPVHEGWSTIMMQKRKTLCSS